MVLARCVYLVKELLLPLLKLFLRICSGSVALFLLKISLEEHIIFLGKALNCKSNLLLEVVCGLLTEGPPDELLNWYHILRLRLWHLSNCWSYWITDCDLNVQVGFVLLKDGI